MEISVSVLENLDVLRSSVEEEVRRCPVPAERHSACQNTFLLSI
jgi:hypothetical protein